MTKLPIIVIFIFVVMNGVAQKDASCDEHVIAKKIFTGYNPNVRPVRSQATPVIVHFRLYIFGIVDVSEQEETISLLTVMYLKWKDEYLTWSVTEPDQNCSSIITRANQLWAPNPIFTNTVDIKQIVTDDQQWLSITNDGIVSKRVISSVTLRCAMRISQFPFDTQRCPMNVTVWTYEYKNLQLVLDSPPSAADVPLGSTEFKTMSLDVTPAENNIGGNMSFSELRYVLVLKRMPEYYVYVIIVPSFMLTSLCIIGMFTPNSNINERTESVTVGLTTLLSMALILNIVAEQMPKSSEGLPLLGYFILYEIITCTLAIILATVVLFVHQRAHIRGWDAPPILFWLTRKKPLQNNTVFPSAIDIYFSMNKNSIFLQGKPRRIVHEIQPVNDRDDKITQTLDIARESCEKLTMIASMIERKIQMVERREIMAKVWAEVTDMADTVLLIIYLIANILVTWLTFR